MSTAEAFLDAIPISLYVVDREMRIVAWNRQREIGPQAIGIGMDLFGPDGFAYALALFFVAYLILVMRRMAAQPSRA